jgi:hypothetical protein
VDWIDEAEREVVERILVLLALLRGCAGGVDCIARLPLLMRVPVLLALSRAESAAQSFIAGLPPAVLAGFAADLPAFDEACETGSWAERLAARLMALAAVLSLVLACGACEEPSRARGAIRDGLRSPAPRRPAASAYRGPAPTPAPDTS